MTHRGSHGYFRRSRGRLRRQRACASELRNFIKFAWLSRTLQDSKCAPLLLRLVVVVVEVVVVKRRAFARRTFAIRRIKAARLRRDYGSRARFRELCYAKRTGTSAVLCLPNRQSSSPSIKLSVELTRPSSVPITSSSLKRPKFQSEVVRKSATQLCLS